MLSEILIPSKHRIHRLPLLLATPGLMLCVALHAQWLGDHRGVAQALVGALGAYVVALVLGLMVARILEATSRTTRPFADLLVIVAVLWLVVIAQWSFPIWVVGSDDMAVSDAVLQAISTVTTSGMSVWEADRSSEQLLLGLGASFGGYLAIKTGYLLARGSHAANLTDFNYAYGMGGKRFDVTLDDPPITRPSEAPTFVGVGHVLSMGRYGLAALYILVILLVMIGFGAVGFSPFKAFLWAAHSVATAGPMPYANWLVSGTLPSSPEGVVASLGMLVGGLVLPAFLLYRVMPRLVIVGAGLWVLGTFFLAWIGSDDATRLSDASLWLGAVNVSSTGPWIGGHAPFLPLPLMVIVAIGAFPCGTGSGIKTTTMGKVVTWLIADTRRLSGRPHQLLRSTGQITQSGQVLRSIPMTVGFYLSCWLLATVVVASVLAMGASDFVAALLVAVAALSNAVSTLDAVGGVSLSEIDMGSFASKIALGFAMLAGRLELAVPALLLLGLRVSNAVRES